MTILDPEIEALRPLYDVEEAIAALLKTADDGMDITKFDVHRCIELLDRLSGNLTFVYDIPFHDMILKQFAVFSLNNFALRQHHRALRLLHAISKIGHDLPPGNDRLAFKFSKMRKLAKLQFSQHVVYLL